MGEVVSSMWASGPPQLPEVLHPLRGWKRERLLVAMERYRSQPQLAIRLATFWRIFGLESEMQASRIFEGLGAKQGGTIDFLSVILPMVLISEMAYISRVTFLFSVSDFNSGGTVLHAEFYIALRSLFKGLHRFFPEAKMPSGKELEEATDEVFREIDLDKSGYLELDEILTYAYRSKDLRLLAAPFPALDHRVFEQLVHFHGVNSESERTREDEVNKADRKLRARLQITPDLPSAPSSKAKAKSRVRPWRQPTILIKPRAYLLWAAFEQLGKNGAIARADLLRVLEDPGKTRQLVADAEARLRQEKLFQLDDDVDDRGRVVVSFRTSLTKPELLDRLADDADGVITLREFCSLIWPTVPTQEVNECLKCCRQFQAMHALQELLKPKDSALVNEEYEASQRGDVDVDEDDITALFEALDLDGDGRLSVEELHKEGNISVRDAQRLLDLWDQERSGTLDKGEIMSIVFNMNQVVERQLRGMFAASMQKAHDAKPPPSGAPRRPPASRGPVGS